MASFSIPKAYAASWKIFSEQWLSLVPITLVFLIISILMSRFVSGVFPSSSLSAAFFSGPDLGNVSNISRLALNVALQGIFTALGVYVYLQYTKPDRQTLRSFTTGLTPEMLVKGIVITFVMSLFLGLVFAAVAFFIVFLVFGGFSGQADTTGTLFFVGATALGFLGLYSTLKYSQSIFVLADTNCSIGEAFRQSGRLTNQVKWLLLLFIVIEVLLAALGIALFGVGVLLTFPIVTVAAADVYRQLSASAS